MGKKLSEMSLEELWQLFPIELVPPREEWKNQYEEMKEELSRMIPREMLLSIEHIGSTSVPGIYAKNIVDILLTVPDEGSMEKVSAILSDSGWIVMSREKSRISFNMGYTENGFADKVYHLHMRLPGDCDELWFRDYLTDHPETAREYEALKLSLEEPYRHDRDGYTEAKTDFISKVTEKAKKEYKNRY